MVEISMGRRLSQFAAEAPERPAISCGDRTMTRQEFDERTNRLAREYLALGVKEQDVVVIALPNGFGFLEAVFAGLKIGATLVPISPKLPDMERESILALAQPALTIGVPHRANDFPTLPANFELDPAISPAPLELDAVSRPMRGLTSGGSTGRPKLIFTTEVGAIDPASSPGMRIEPGETVIVPGPLYHGMPFAYSYRTLMSGGHVVVMEQFDSAACLSAVQRYSAQILPLVPTMMSRIWELGDAARDSFDLSSLRMVVHSASSCPAWLKEMWIEWLGAERIHEFYGSTERIGFTWITGPEWLAHKGSVGRPYDSTIRILDEDGKEVRTGEVGEIYMRNFKGPATTYRYVGAEPLKQTDGFETVGDMGWVDSDGYLYIADRRVDMVISGGANIFPAEVEAALDHHPLVLGCAVIGLPDNDLGNRVHAIVHADQHIDEGALRNWLRERLVSYKIPRSFEFVDTSLRDEAGKLRRSHLRNQRLPPPSTHAEASKVAKGNVA